MRPRPQGLQIAFIAGLQGLLSLYWIYSAFARPYSSPPLWMVGLLLLAAALLWGGAIGGLLYAFWPAPPEAEPDPRFPGVRPPLPRKITRTLYNVPAGVLSLLALAALSTTFLPRQRPVQLSQQEQQEQAISQFVSTNFNLFDTMSWGQSRCDEILGIKEDPANIWCLNSDSDGYVLINRLEQALKINNAELIGVSSLPWQKKGNLISGQVQARVPVWGSFEKTKLPISLEYVGLVLTNQTQPLSAQERQLSQKRFPSYVIVRRGN